MEANLFLLYWPHLKNRSVGITIYVWCDANTPCFQHYKSFILILILQICFKTRFTCFFFVFFSKQFRGPSWISGKECWLLIHCCCCQFELYSLVCITWGSYSLQNVDKFPPVPLVFLSQLSTHSVSVNILERAVKIKKIV